MLAVFLAFAFVTAHVAAEIPSYFNVCGRRQANLEECIMKNIFNSKDIICRGIPELEVPRSEPFHLDTIVISNTSSTKIIIHDGEISGFCDYIVNFLKVDLVKNFFDLDMTFKHLKINGTCDTELYLIIPFKSYGPIFIETEDVKAKVHIDMEVKTMKGKERLYLSNMKIKLYVKGYTSDYILPPELKQLDAVIRNFIDTNQREILDLVLPYIENVVSKQVLDMSNKIVTHFTYDEILPDRT